MSDLTPEQTDAVRRALRAARHDAPLPDAVAARLDDRLAALAAERTSGMPGEPDAPVEPAGTTVVPLRRRRWPAVLAAAAAVTAIGLAGAQLIEPRGESESLTSAESAADGEAPSADAHSYAEDDPGTLDSLGAQVGGLPALTRTQIDQLTDEGYRRVRMLLTPVESASVLADGRAAAQDEARDEVERNTSAKTASPWKELSSGTSRMPTVPCGAEIPPALLDQATLYQARHDGESVVLVVLPGPEVSAYPCGGGEPTAVPLD